MVIKIKTITWVKSKDTRNYALYKRNIALKRKFTVPIQCEGLCKVAIRASICLGFKSKKGSKNYYTAIFAFSNVNFRRDLSYYAGLGWTVMLA